MSHEIDRRTVVAGIAGALPAAAIGAAPALGKPDPAFAAIETHRQAWRDLDDIAIKCDDMRDDPRRQTEADRAERLALDTVSAAEDQFVLSQPTTILGVAAVLRYIAEHDAEHGGDICGSGSCFENEDGEALGFKEALHITLADTLERIADGRAIGPGRLMTKFEAEDDDEEDEADEAEVVQEPCRERTLEEWADFYRELIDGFTTKLGEIEAQIAAGVTS